MTTVAQVPVAPQPLPGKEREAFEQHVSASWRARKVLTRRAAPRCAMPAVLAVPPIPQPQAGEHRQRRDATTRHAGPCPGAKAAPEIAAHAAERHRAFASSHLPGPSRNRPHCIQPSGADGQRQAACRSRLKSRCVGVACVWLMQTLIRCTGPPKRMRCVVARARCRRRGSTSPDRYLRRRRGPRRDRRRRHHPAARLLAAPR